jgi:hypothetical protein
MEKLNALMETAEMGNFFENNQEIINEVAVQAGEFSDSIKDYVYANPEVFMEAEVSDMVKNIRIFSEAAMSQYMTEITAVASQESVILEPVTSENVLNDYI